MIGIKVEYAYLRMYTSLQQAVRQAVQWFQ